VWLAATFFGSAFYASVFGLPPSLRGMTAIFGIGALVAGVLIGGPLVNSVGRKRLAVTSAFTAVLISVLAYAIAVFFPNIWLSIGMHTVSGFLGGFVFVAGNNLSLEQVPKYRGTMLSLGQGLSGIGRATGIFVGGIVLTMFSTTATGYAVTIATLAVIGLTGTLSLVLFAKDPCRNLPQTPLDSS
jgi:MFS family permease